MNVLIADDDPITRKLLENTVRRWDHEVYAAADGLVALEMYRQNEAIEMVILDWIMPGMDGLATCKAIRELNRAFSPYIIMLTSKAGTDFIVDALEVGADDYLTKPPNPGELQARFAAGVRLVNMQREFHQKIARLEDTVQRMEDLETQLPVCTECKQVRDDAAYLESVATLIRHHAAGDVSLAKCLDCISKSATTTVKPAPAG